MRWSILRWGTAQNPTTKAEAALLVFTNAPSFSLSAEFLRALTRQNNARVNRPDVLYCCLRAMQKAAGEVAVLLRPRCGSAPETVMRAGPLREVPLAVICC